MKLLATLLISSLAGCATTAAGLNERDPVPGQDFDTLAARAPSQETLLALARLLAAQGRAQECEKVLEKLLSDHPKCAQGYNELAELYLRSDFEEKAALVLAEGAERTDDAVLWNNLGMCQLMMKDYEKALASFQRAAELRPQDARAEANRALALALLGRSEEARHAYGEVVTERDAQHNMAVLLNARKKLEASSSSY